MVRLIFSCTCSDSLLAAQIAWRFFGGLSVAVPSCGQQRIKNNYRKNTRISSVTFRTFLRRMIDLLCAFRRDGHPIRLNQEFRRDLTWWRELFQTWDGLSFFCMPTWAPLPDFQVSSDAAGSLGYGAIFKSHWFAGAWSAAQSSSSIAYKELFPIVVAAYLWGHQWVSRRVEFFCDNESVVAVLKSGTSRDKNVMVLLRYLTILAIHHSFSFAASSVRGKANPVADALCRFQFQRFRRLEPQADPTPSPIPASLLAALQMH